MKNSRRIKRMSRNRVTVPKMNLTSLMDVFTILVFFLLVNSATTEVLETPKQIVLPASFVEEKPRETVVIFISATDVTVQGEAVIQTPEILMLPTQRIDPIATRLSELSASVIGLSTETVATESRSHDPGGPNRPVQRNQAGHVDLHRRGVRPDLSRRPSKSTRDTALAELA